MIHFDISKLEEELKDLENKTMEPNFWEDSQKSNKILEKMKSIKNKCTKYRDLESEINNIIEIMELVKVEYDEELAIEAIKNIRKIEKMAQKFEIEVLLSGKYDKNNAILTLHPGAGGTEAQDWVEMLYRMYTRWANRTRVQSRRIRLFRR